MRPSRFFVYTMAARGEDLSGFEPSFSLNGVRWADASAGVQPRITRLFDMDASAPSTPSPRLISASDGCRLEVRAPGASSPRERAEPTDPVSFVLALDLLSARRADAG
jgi:hypothetical protein